MTQPAVSISLPSLFNPGLQDDESLIAGFVARQDLLEYFISELRAVAPQGTVQHHLIIGARGMGKTTLLKRLAIAIRQDVELSGRLIPLTFPEEQYNVKDLADLWLNAMDALGDELERSGRTEDAHSLDDAIAKLEGEGLARDTLARRARALLVDRCAVLGRRPVMLVDNIDIVFARVDKSGRKVKNPDSGAYWELREALSRSDAPVLIGGSVRLSEPMVTYEKAFYDFFAVHRLEKLTFDEMRAVLGHLADRHGVLRVRQMLAGEVPRLRTLHDLTGGNVRTVLFLFHLLAQGVESDVREDLERLLDMVTPLYKARFEELAEQSQIVLHALAMRWSPASARDVANDCRLVTGLVSAQLESLQKEGMVDKVQLGRSRKMGYQVAERFFNLWLLMRTSRRMRQKLAYLTKFLESFYDASERHDLAQRLLCVSCCGRERSRAELAWALANTMEGTEEAQALKAHAGTLFLDYCSATSQRIAEIIGDGDLPKHQLTLLECREVIRRNAVKIRKAGINSEEFELASMGSLLLSIEMKQQLAKLVEVRIDKKSIRNVMEALNAEAQAHIKSFQITPDILKKFRLAIADGMVNMNSILLSDVKAAAMRYGAQELLRAFWTLLYNYPIEFSIPDESEALAWISWAANYHLTKRQPQLATAELSMFAIRLAKAHNNEAALFAFQQSLNLDNKAPWLWTNMGYHLQCMNRYDEAEKAYRNALELDPNDSAALNNLGYLLQQHLGRYEESEQVYRKAVAINPKDGWSWNGLGNLLQDHLGRFEESEQAYQNVLQLDSDNSVARTGLAILALRLGDVQKALDVIGLLADQTDKSSLQILLELRRDNWNKASSAFKDLFTSFGQEIQPANLGDILRILAWSIVCKQGEKMLNQLDELGARERFWPLVAGFEAALANDADMLLNIAPEVRGVAQRIFETIRHMGEGLLIEQ